MAVSNQVFTEYLLLSEKCVHGNCWGFQCYQQKDNIGVEPHLVTFNLLSHFGTHRQPYWFDHAEFNPNKSSKGCHVDFMVIFKTDKSKCNKVLNTFFIVNTESWVRLSTRKQHRQRTLEVF